MLIQNPWHNMANIFLFHLDALIMALSRKSHTLQQSNTVEFGQGHYRASNGTFNGKICRFIFLPVLL